MQRLELSVALTLGKLLCGIDASVAFCVNRSVLISGIPRIRLGVSVREGLELLLRPFVQVGENHPGGDVQIAFLGGFASLRQAAASKGDDLPVLGVGPQAAA